MADQILLYISAAPDLKREREILGRAVTEIPVTLRWRIVQSPSRDDPIDLAAVSGADLHLLLLGSDIRAPVGLEWVIARRDGHWPVPFLKRGVLRTPAAESFVRYIGEQASWHSFRDAADLRLQALRLLAHHILERAVYYALSAEELARLQTWRFELEASTPAISEARSGTGESGVVLSRERYVPSEGILIQPDTDKENKKAL
jgi:hypothetical protein